MSNEFLVNILTRRNLVQIVYQNEFQYLNDCDYYVSENYDFKGKEVNIELFNKILNRIFNLWSEYDSIFSNLHIELKGLSLVAIAIIKVAFAEFLEYKREKKSIISEYIKVSEYFLNDYEIKILNKILDVIYKETIDY